MFMNCCMYYCRDTNAMLIGSFTNYVYMVMDWSGHLISMLLNNFSNFINQNCQLGGRGVKKGQKSVNVVCE